jgi:catechol 2,3-dioxygenase-like lactoylglutathione lyase family enzyme
MGFVKGIDTVFYQVCNMDRAVAFYEGTLGLTLARREANDWAEFETGSAVNLALSGELAVAPQGGGATVVLATDDLDALYADLQGKGVRTGQVNDLGGARMLDVYDPDGNQLVVLQPVTG